MKFGIKLLNKTQPLENLKIDARRMEFLYFLVEFGTTRGFSQI